MMHYQIVFSYESHSYINQTRYLQNHFNMITPSLVLRLKILHVQFLDNWENFKIISTLKTSNIKFPIDLIIAEFQNKLS